MAMDVYLIHRGARTERWLVDLIVPNAFDHEWSDVTGRRWIASRGDWAARPITYSYPTHTIVKE